jgi:hypothetical protein
MEELVGDDALHENHCLPNLLNQVRKELGRNT